MRAESPCFNWWPKDILADMRVQILSLEEEGAYRRLIDYCWMEGRVPNDPSQLGRLCKIDTSTKEGLERATALRDRLEPLFVKAAGSPEWWTHKRVEKEREEQNARRTRKQIAGKRGAASRWGDMEQ